MTTLKNVLTARAEAYRNNPEYRRLVKEGDRLSDKADKYEDKGLYAEAKVLAAAALVEYREADKHLNY